MAYTAINAINAILKGAQVIQGSGEELSGSLTDSRIQHSIDVALSRLNSVIHELYRLRAEPLPQQATTENITLVTSTREYTITVEEIDWPLIEQTLGQYIYEYPGGYEAMRKDQNQPSSYTGRPLYAAVNPTNGKLRMDRVPTSAENGDVYVLAGKKRLVIDAYDDAFPFNDTVVDAVVDAVIEWFELKERNDFKAIIAIPSLARAASYLNPNPPASHY